MQSTRRLLRRQAPLLSQSSVISESFIDLLELLRLVLPGPSATGKNASHRSFRP